MDALVSTLDIKLDMDIEHREISLTFFDKISPVLPLQALPALQDPSPTELVALEE